MSPPLSLYVHFPWCVAKCPYCDFNSHENLGPGDEERYISQLIRDLALEDLEQRRFETVFFGGGTPSLMQPVSVAQVLDELREKNLLVADAEITLEANPGTADAANFRGYHEAGVNRLSLGIQSLDDDSLAALGRIHGAKEARAAVGMARDAGFDNINLDLMFGLPGQSEAAMLADLEGVIALAPEHLSWYQLTIEPNTRFYSSPPLLPVLDEIATWQQSGESLLSGAGFSQYEVSAWAQPGRECRHNMNYWLFGDYVGIGAGAHGKLTAPDGRIIRTTRTRVPRDYLANPNRRTRPIETDDLALEFLMNALRLKSGFPNDTFEARTGSSEASLMSAIRDAVARHLIVSENGVTRATPLGYRHLDSVLGLI